MRAHLVQTDIAWEDPTENFARVRALLERAESDEGDLIVLPEMFATGFSLRNEQTTAASANILEFLMGLADERRAHVHGGRTIAIPGSSMAHNTAPVVSPEGDVVAEYAKIHPFGFGRETEAITPGEHTACWDWVSGDRSIRVGLAICYDLRFPELFRTLALDGDAACFVLGANWPDARQTHWRTLAIARAIENQAFMLAVNRCGNDPHLAYAGGSIAIDPTGRVMGELGDQPGVLSVAVDPSTAIDWRSRFPALDDVRLLG